MKRKKSILIPIVLICLTWNLLSINFYSFAAETLLEEHSTSAGIVQQNGTLSLDTKYLVSKSSPYIMDNYNIVE